MPEWLKGPGEISVDGPGILYSWQIGGLTINLTETVVLSFLITIIVLSLAAWLTKDLKEKPTTKRQVVAEFAVETITKLVRENMGVKFNYFIPYVAALFCYSFFGSIIGVFGFRSVTADYNAPLTWALIAFIMIQFYMAKTAGPWGYIKGYLNPLNIIGELAKPVSMSFRHFGNIGGGMIISSLIYFALAAASRGLHLPIPLLTIGIPAVLSAYFDWFSSAIQAFIFVMLTMINISIAAGGVEEGNA